MKLKKSKGNRLYKNGELIPSIFPSFLSICWSHDLLNAFIFAGWVMLFIQGMKWFYSLIYKNL